MTTSLDINEKVFEKYKKEAREESIANMGDDGKDEFSFDSLDLRYDVSETPTFDEEENVLNLYADLYKNKENLGRIYIDIPLDFDTVIKIIEAYRNRLGKLKTVLEATKD